MEEMQSINAHCIILMEIKYRSSQDKYILETL